TASGTGMATAPTDPGTYTVVADFTSTNPNYGNGESGPATFTIRAPDLAQFDGNYTGSYSGTTSINDNGTVTTTPLGPVSFQATITNGVIAITTPDGTGTGSLNAKGKVAGSLVVTIEGVKVSVQLTGKITAADASGTTGAGEWSYSANLGNGAIAK